MIPPWDEINEELAEELDQLFEGKVSSGGLLAELTVLKGKCLGQKVLKNMSIREVAKFVYNQRHVHPTSNIAYAFLQTVPVTVASNERSFSKLKLVKT